MSWTPMASVSIYYKPNLLHRAPLKVMMDNTVMTTIYPGEHKRFSIGKKQSMLKVTTSKQTSPVLKLDTKGADVSFEVSRNLLGKILLQPIDKLP